MNKLEESYDAIRWFFRGLGFEKGILHISISGSAIMMDLSKSREDVLLGTIAQLTASLGCRGKTTISGKALNGEPLSFDIEVNDGML